MKFLVGLCCGALFALGLIVSGMTNPARVQGFLDPLGQWDPSLGLVMFAALATHAPLVYWLRRRGSAWLEPKLHLPANSAVDARLISGALLFGVGWGLAGYCPGPALVSVTTSRTALWVCIAMVVGMWLHDKLMVRPRTSASPEQNPTQPPPKLCEPARHFH